MGAQQSAANLLLNGSFEDGTLLGGGVQTLAPGSDAMTDWAVTSGEIDWIDTGFWQATDGGRSVDMNATVPGAISQSFTTVVGQTYVLSFDLAANPYIDNSPPVKILHVSVAGSSQDFSFDTSGRTYSPGVDLGYTGQTLQFIATSVTTTLEFSSLTSGNAGPVLDNVRVEVDNQPPVADAGSPQTVFSDELVTLDGTGSFDPEHQDLTYEWQVPLLKKGQSEIVLIGADTATPTFVAPSPGVYTISLFVSDGALIAEDAVTITVDQVPTTTALVSDIHPSISGQSVTFTAKVSSANGEIPTGIVVFSDGTTDLTEGLVVSTSGEASFQTDALSVGDHKIIAVFNRPAAPAMDPPLVEGQVKGTGVKPMPVLIAKQPPPVVESYETSTASLMQTVNPASHNIEASAGPNGSISPSGTVVVSDGGSQAFAIAANQGCNVLEVLVDGTSVGPVTSYTFTNVTANHSIVASFNRAPDVSGAAPSIASIWPPNHKMVPIAINGVTDPDGDGVTINITSVQIVDLTTVLISDNTNPAADAAGIGTNTALVRATRKGKGTGRTYIISFTAADGKGGTTSGSVTVVVPHNGPNGELTDDDQGDDHGDKDKVEKKDDDKGKKEDSKVVKKEDDQAKKEDSKVVKKEDDQSKKTVAKAPTKKRAKPTAVENATWGEVKHSEE